MEDLMAALKRIRDKKKKGKRKDFPTLQDTTKAVQDRKKLNQNALNLIDKKK